MFFRVSLLVFRFSSSNIPVRYMISTITSLVRKTNKQKQQQKNKTKNNAVKSLLINFQAVYVPLMSDIFDKSPFCLLSRAKKAMLQHFANIVITYSYHLIVTNCDVEFQMMECISIISCPFHRHDDSRRMFSALSSWICLLIMPVWCVEIC